VNWLPDTDGISVTGKTIIESSTAATKVISACEASNEFTIEAWVRPANTTQEGPARIVTISDDTTHRNVTIGQDETDYIGRNRATVGSDHNGRPNLVATDTLKADLTHVVYTYESSGDEQIYINGVEETTRNRGGKLDWNDSYRLALANELSFPSDDRSWLGRYYQVAIYDYAFTQEEVEQHMQDMWADFTVDDMGAPDSGLETIVGGESLVIDMANTPIVADGFSGDDDMVYYEQEQNFPGSGNIYLDSVIISVGASNSGPWYEVFHWGDSDDTNNGHLGGGYSPENNDKYILMSDLYGSGDQQTGIQIDVDAVPSPPPDGSYRYVRIENIDNTLKFDTVTTFP
jgi:hypothetical protein